MEYLADHNYKTYTKIFEAACHLKQVSKEGRSATFKRPFNKEAILPRGLEAPRQSDK